MINKKKIIIAILILLLLSVLIVLFGIINKVVIIRGIQNKLAQYNNITNCHYKIINEDNKEQYYECFGKDETLKKISKDGNDELIQMEYKDKVKKFVNNQEGKKLYIYEEEYKPSLFAFSINYMISKEDTKNTITYSINANIDTKKENEKEYYVLSGIGGFYGINSEKTEIYVDKETGLAEKMVNSFEDGTKQVMLYETKFDIVTDEDLKEPDESEYEIVEVNEKTEIE